MVDLENYYVRVCPSEFFFFANVVGVCTTSPCSKLPSLSLVGIHFSPTV